MKFVLDSIFLRIYLTFNLSILEDLQSISFSSNSFSLLVQIILNSWLRIIFHDDQISNSSNSWNIISPHTLITLVNLTQLSADSLESSEKDPSASLQRFPQDVDKQVESPGMAERSAGVTELQLEGLTVSAVLAGEQLQRPPAEQYLHQPRLSDHGLEQGVLQLDLLPRQPEAQVVGVTGRIERLEVAASTTTDWRRGRVF